MYTCLVLFSAELSLVWIVSPYLPLFKCISRQWRNYLPLSLHHIITLIRWKETCICPYWCLFQFLYSKKHFDSSKWDYFIECSYCCTQNLDWQVPQLSPLLDNLFVHDQAISKCLGNHSLLFTDFSMKLEHLMFKRSNAQFLLQHLFTRYRGRCSTLLFFCLFLRINAWKCLNFS